MNTEGKTKGELLAMAGILEWVAQQERTSYEADENSGRMYAEYAAELRAAAAGAMHDRYAKDGCAVPCR